MEESVRPTYQRQGRVKVKQGHGKVTRKKEGRRREDNECRQMAASASEENRFSALFLKFCKNSTT
jgi:hypothetical protein